MSVDTTYIITSQKFVGCSHFSVIAVTDTSNNLHLKNLPFLFLEILMGTIQVFFL